MERIAKVMNWQKAVFWSALASETSHVLCCGLPIIVSLFSLMAEIGLLSVIPSGILDVHEIMHDYEIPMIIFSGVVLMLGWGLHHLSMRIDCHDTGCGHGPCEPKKTKSSKILKLATVLFIANISLYGFVHTGL